MADQQRSHQRLRGRDPQARLDDHEAIAKLADALLPSLIAKLGATGLGEIEVREGDWRVRLRRPADGARSERRGTERTSRAQATHPGHGHAPGGVDAARPASGPATGGAAYGGGTAHGGATGGGAPMGPGRGDGAEGYRAVATSPAVGYFQPRPEVSSGTRVRTGDRLGVVDMLGVPQDVVAPVDGIVGRKSVAVGNHVQPGQQLLVVVQVDHLWVTANFKETQVERMRIGQRARVSVDAYGTDLDASVESMPGASGARFSLFPPENATGNYVKVVQRLPVRLRVFPNQKGYADLRPGMSVEPKVFIR